MEFKLILKKLNNKLTEEEERIFNDWLSESETHRSYFEKVQYGYLEKSLDFVDLQRGWEHINSKMNSPKGGVSHWKYVAAAVVLVLLSLPFLITKQESTPQPATVVADEAIQIGTDKATLTLEDGTKVPLEKGKAFDTRTLSSNGKELVYKTKADKSETIKYNTLTIPRGGQFYLVLSDGTKVWLNSDSELRYPVTFVNNIPRKVELLYGEAYFEVSPSAQNNGTRFLVATQGQEIDVLGTEFNVRAFKEDSFIETTLVNGKVVIRNGENTNDLTPGSQSKLDKGSHEIRIAKADVYNVISWKDGLFSFKNMALSDIMTVLSRWYDVDVDIVNKEAAKVTFNGVFNRNQDLKNILLIIQNTNEAKLTTKGKTIMVE